MRLLRDSPEKALCELLCDLFDARSLIQFLALSYPALYASLPAQPTSADEVAFSAVWKLKAHGEITETLFQLLLEERPARRPDIIACALHWQIPCSLQSEKGLSFENWLAARDHLDAAARAVNASDGLAALAHLDAHDRLDAKRKTEYASSQGSITRAQALLLTGRCQEGKALLISIYSNTLSSHSGPEQIDRTVEAMVSLWGRGGDMSPREQLLAALSRLQIGAFSSIKTSDYCDECRQTILRLKSVVQPRDDEDVPIIHLD